MYYVIRLYIYIYIVLYIPSGEGAQREGSCRGKHACDLCNAYTHTHTHTHTHTYISSQVKELTEKGLVEESEGARVIHCGKAFPLMPVKSDGGYISVQYVYIYI
jgi:hypothetical protein